MRYLYAVWCALALLNCSLECFRVLQSASYRPQRGYFRIFFTWYYLLLLLLTAFAWLWYFYIGIEVVICGVYTAIALPLIFVKRKSPLKFTKRIWRMVAIEFVLLLVACYYALHFWALMLPFFVLLSWIVSLPLEIAIAKKYLKRAQRKLELSQITIIAITGSYGKTSAKDMLTSLLSHSISPKGSCNTPLGIAAFINATDLSKYKFLILEFGARKTGDIKELCNLYKPNHGIVTGVCAQHMSTFKTLENVLATKGELTAYLPQNGICLLGDKSVEELSCVGMCKKSCAGVKVTNLAVSEKGIAFTAVRGKKREPVSLPQITAYSAQTFALCATMCIHLGQSFEETVQNAQFVRQTSHRMEISHNGHFYIIDDSYNASVKGVEGCIAVLRKLQGVKVAICQGIVECGANRKAMNEYCGEQFGSVCDAVIVLGKNRKALQVGAQKSDCKAVVAAKKLTEAVELARPYLSRDSFLLFQNDLPDVVNI